MYEVDHGTIIHRLHNHPPQTDEVSEVLDSLTGIFISVGQDLVDLLPEGREKSIAFTKLEELSMWSKAAVARNQT